MRFRLVWTWPEKAGRDWDDEGTHVDISTLNDLLNLAREHGSELIIFPNGDDCNTGPTIEIYNGYRE